MIWGTNKQPKKGLNIELTDLQYEYLHELVMFAYEMDTPDQKGWDMPVSYTHLTLPTSPHV